jgi:hypothetical protein
VRKWGLFGLAAQTEQQIAKPLGIGLKATRTRLRDAERQVAIILAARGLGEVPAEIEETEEEQDG